MPGSAVQKRIDHLLVTAPLKHRVVWPEIDREAREGKQIPSDHALLVIYIDSHVCSINAGLPSAILA
jgi:exodeoxyribonuclease-3